MVDRASERIEIEALYHIRVKRLAATASIDLVARAVEDYGISDRTGQRYRVLNRQVGKTERSVVPAGKR